VLRGRGRLRCRRRMSGPGSVSWVGVSLIMFTHLGASYASYEIVNLDVRTAFYFALISSSQDVAYTGRTVAKPRVCAAVNGALDKRLSETAVGSLESREPL
jgi:hypothetical protein